MILIINLLTKENVAKSTYFEHFQTILHIYTHFFTLLDIFNFVMYF